MVFIKDFSTAIKDPLLDLTRLNDVFTSTNAKINTPPSKHDPTVREIFVRILDSSKYALHFVFVYNNKKIFRYNKVKFVFNKLFVILYNDK